MPEAKAADPAKPLFNQFIAVGMEGLRMVSGDGTTWSKPQLQKDRPPRLLSIATGNDCVVAAGPYGGANVFMRSTDLRTWEVQIRMTDKKGALQSVAFGGGQFITQCSDGTCGNGVSSSHFSNDGKQWSDQVERQKRAGDPILRDIQRKMTRTVWGNGQWLGIGTHGLKAVSKDGRQWQESPDQVTAEALIDVVYAKERFVGVGLHGLRMASADGLKWTAKQLSEEGEHIHSLVFTGKEFVGIGLGATYFSSDGSAWTRKPNTDAPVCCAYGKGVFVGAVYPGRILVSKDALTWKQVLVCEQHVQAVAFV